MWVSDQMLWKFKLLPMVTEWLFVYAWKRFHCRLQVILWGSVYICVTRKAILAFQLHIIRGGPVIKATDTWCPSWQTERQEILCHLWSRRVRCRVRRNQTVFGQVDAVCTFTPYIFRASFNNILAPTPGSSNLNGFPTELLFEIFIIECTVSCLILFDFIALVTFSEECIQAVELFIVSILLSLHHY